MKGFGIEIKNDLLEPKHVVAMGTAVWLYMWLIDKITSVTEEEIGIVLGGKPVKFEEIAAELGISQDTYTRWLNKLLEYPYIAATRTPYGISFQVFKAHKKFRKRDSAFSRRDSAESRSRFRTNAESNKTYTKTYTKTSPKGEAKSPAPNPVISSLFQELRELNSGMLDGSEKENRRYCWLLLQKFKYRESPESAAKLTRALMAAAKADEFHRRNSTGFKYLYYNAARIIQTAQSQKSKVHIIPA